MMKKIPTTMVNHVLVAMLEATKSGAGALGTFINR